MGAYNRNNQTTLVDNFKNMWYKLLDEINNDSNLSSCDSAVKWLNIVMRSTVPNGKQQRGIACFMFYRELVGNRLTSEGEKLSFIAGWLLEISQAAALIADDIMDESVTRRGETCWYKRKHVGLSAVNDVLFLENISFFMVYKYFSGQPYFDRLLSFFHDIILKTVMGQCMDTRTAKEFNLDRFTLAKYRQIVDYKTSYYTFYTPLATALIIAGFTDELLFKAIEKISMELGFLFQAQDDFLDCYGDPVIIGKVGTDIEEKKCTWLLVKALENSENKNILKSCYSEEKPDAKTIRKIYDSIGIPDIFLDFEKECYENIGRLIAELPEGIPKAPLRKALNVMYRRQK